MTDIHGFVETAFGANMHMKRIQSLSNAASGVIASGSLAIHAIGAGLALANEIQRKYAIKQVDRLLSNPVFNLPALFRDWVPFIVAGRRTLMISMDWTNVDAGCHATLVLSLQTEHGRNTPLLWQTCRQDELKGRRNDVEDALLRQLYACLPEGVHVTIVADCGFSDVALYHFIREGLGFDYVIRMKGNIQVTDSKGRSGPVSDWFPCRWPGEIGQAGLRDPATLPGRSGHLRAAAAGELKAASRLKHGATRSGDRAIPDNI